MKINSKTQKPMALAEAYEAMANKANSNDANKLITESWAPMITRTTGVTNPDKLEWISQLAHNTAKSLNEAANVQVDGQTNPAGFGGVYTPYNTLYNTLGVGNVVPAQRAALTAAQQASDAFNGSGDKFPALVPLAIKVAAKTVGFELVNNIPMDNAAGCLPYMDYVYSGSKQPYGATPSYSAATANIAGKFHNKNAYELYDLPSAFKAAVSKTDSSAIAFSVGTTFTTDPSTMLVVEFAGKSRIDGDPMFKVVSGTASLGQIYDTSTGAVVLKTLDGVTTLKTYAPRLISMQEDQILGYAGAGEKDEDAWIGTFQDGTEMYEPMSRGVGEMTAPRQISLRLFTKNIQAGTIQVGCGVTQEQVTDLQKQWGIDVIKVVENAGIAELSQTINRHITSRLFGLGWKNALKLYEVEGANLNLTFDASTQNQNTLAYAWPDGQWIPEQNTYERTEKTSMPFAKFNVVTGAAFENRDTLIKRIYTNILAASNWIQQRGRYGAANFAVTNITLATLLQSGAHYSFSPMENTVSQGAGQLYPIGKICGITVYVDPLMSAQDNRILVGRKGEKDEPGTYFCPYVMAEVVRTIAEGTGAPKLFIKSRYALVDAGFFPETQYFTFAVNVASL